MDHRRVIGNRVEARACLLTNLSECSRRYGANAKTYMVPGIVVDVISERNSKTGRAACYILADYDFGGGFVKRQKLNVRSVVAINDATTTTTTEPTPMDIDPATATPFVTETTTRVTHTNMVDSTIDVRNIIVPIVQNVVNVHGIPGLTNGTVVAAAIAPPERATTPSTPERVVTRFQLTSPSRRNVVASPNGTDWYNEPITCLSDINGPFPFREWGQRTSTGDVLRAGDNSDERYSRLEVFMMMFPPKELAMIIYATNKILEKKRKRLTTEAEVLKLFGVIILITKYEFRSRASLWSNSSPSKYEQAPAFGKTGMSRGRFDDLWTSLRFAFQPSERPDYMSSETYRWLLVDQFVKNFNEYREKTFIPSDVICVDESISRWYGQGGEWINHGLPMYVAIDRKPENGCEIQDASCGRSGIMIQLKIVKTATEQQNLEVDHDERILHGTKIIKELVKPWSYTDRMVCADSYFASVGAADALKLLKFRFIGVVKTATRHFPMSYLNTLVLNDRGDRQGVVRRDINGQPDLMAFVWMDRDRRYFICSGGSLAEGAPYVRHRWRQVDQELNAEPERVELVVTQPKAAEIYYSVCGKVDQHNRDRQDTLCIERKLKTNDWSLRVNMTIFGMLVVDSWRMYSLLTYGSNVSDNNAESQKDFYGHLAAELIDNTYDQVGGTGARRSFGMDDTAEGSPAVCHRTGGPRAGVSAHLTPTKRRIKDKEGCLTPNSFQGRCRVCKKKTTYQCSVCKDDPDIHDEGWICHTKKGQMCFPTHITQSHTT
jgi:hypothetical protein